MELSPAAKGLSPEAAAVLLVMAALVFAMAIIVWAFFCRTVQNALNRVAPHNRLMQPDLAWLYLLPVFNQIVWIFFIAVKVPNSLRNEFRERGHDDGSDYGKSSASYMPAWELLPRPS